MTAVPRLRRRLKVVQERKDLIMADTDESKEETETFNHEEVSDDIPQSLLSYCQASTKRASVCEGLILQDLEDLPVSHHAEGLINLLFDLERDSRTQSEKMQMSCETYSETGDSSVQKGGAVKSSSETTAEKPLCEEEQRTEQRLQREKDFQEELRKITETEKLRQLELELIRRGAQEKIEQELLLQQELMGNLKRQVEQERRRIEEERKTREKEKEGQREEESKRKREEERVHTEKEQSRRREEDKKKREEERRIEGEDRRKKEEEKESKCKEDEQKRKMKEEEKKNKEEEEKSKEEKWKKEESKCVEDEQKRKMGEENKKKREQERVRMKEEQNRRREENKKKRDEEGKRFEDEKRRWEEEDKRKRQGRKTTDEESEKFKFVGMNLQEECDGERREEEQKKKKRNENRSHEEERDRDNEETRWRKEERNVKDFHFRTEERIGLVEEGEKKRKGDADTEVEENEGKEEEILIQVMRNMEQEDEKRPNEKEKMLKDEMRKKEEDNNKVEEEKEKRSAEALMRMDLDEMRTEEEEKQKVKVWTKRTRMDGELTRKEDDCRTEKDRKLVKEGKDQKKRDEGTIQSYMKHLELKEPTWKTNHQMEKQEIEIRRLSDKEYRKSEEEASVHEDAEDCKGHGQQTGDTNTERQKDEWETGARSMEEDVKLGVEKGNACEEEKTDGENRLIEETGGRERRDESDEEEMMSTRKNLKEKNGSDPTRLLSSGVKSDKHICLTSANEAMEQPHPEAKPRPSSCFSPAHLPEHTEHKRLSWMTECVSWSQLSLQNRRKQKRSAWSRRGRRRVAGACSPPPLCPQTLLRSSGWKSLQEVTTLTLEDLSTCCLSTLVQCHRLRSLTLRRCGLRSVEGISQLKDLCFVDLQENDISSVDCENMTCLRVLQLSHNKLKSIHGLGGAESLDVLDLSYNSITRIAGLESAKRLQKLLVHHNQLISTKGLRDVYTLLHLDCSHNHLASVEGLDGSALLHTLDLSSNSLSEPPSLNNQVLLRTLHLDDNSISSLQGLAGCWLPLLQHLSASQNRITQLPNLTDFVSLESLDLRFNCLSELQNVCESLEGCHFLREALLSGNPVEQERGWRLVLHRALPGLRARPVNLDPFLMFCQAQLQQTLALQQRHSSELSKASSPTLQTHCWYLTAALQLAEDHRLAHENGHTSVSSKVLTKTHPEKTPEVGCASPEKIADYPQSESVEASVIPNMSNIKDRHLRFRDQPAEENHHNTSDTTGSRTKSTDTKMREINFLKLDEEPPSSVYDLDLKNRAAGVIQQRWRKYKQKHGNTDAPFIMNQGGDEGKMVGPSCVSRSTVSQEHAAAVIQAFWRGFIVRRRLASALAVVMCLDDGEDDILEEVDMEEFVFDESPVTELSLQGALQPPPTWIPKEAWMAEQQDELELQPTPAEGFNRSQPPASVSAHCGLSETSEKILEEWGFTDRRTALLLLKRAQKMKSAKHKQKHSEPSVHDALLGNSNNKFSSAEARSRPAQHSRYCLTVGVAELGLQQTKQTRRQRDQRQLQTDASQSDRLSDREPFLPGLSSSVLSGGRVQLVADSSHVDGPQLCGACANTSLVSRPFKPNTSPHRHNLGHSSRDVSSQLAPSASSTKEHISFRGKPVQLSGFWGGGKKRDRSKTFSHK